MFYNTERSIEITVLSSKFPFPKGMVHWILNIVLIYSLVSQEKETSKYKLGLQIAKYSNSFYNSFDFRQSAKPILNKACNETKETTFLTVWRNNQGICIDSISSNRDVNTHLFVESGREMSVPCTTSSKVILANQPIEDVKKITNEKLFQKYTIKTIADPKKLEEN